MNMYPWYKESHPISVSKLYSPPAAPLSNIKKEAAFKDCMVSLDYSQNKVCNYMTIVHNYIYVVSIGISKVYRVRHEMRQCSAVDLGAKSGNYY